MPRLVQAKTRSCQDPGVACKYRKIEKAAGIDGLEADTFAR